VMGACCVLMAVMDGHEWLAAVAMLCCFGASAVGWNGVYLATVARIAPDEAATATAGTLIFCYLGIVVGPLVLGLVSAATGGLGVAFALLVLPLLVALWFLRKGEWS
jgi:predicted MFS family arabinose efflux permease